MFGCGRAHTKTLPHGHRSGPSKGAKSMDIVSIIVTLVVGGVIGWLASIVMRTDAQQGIVLNVGAHDDARSEEHTYELQSLMRISYAVFCLKTKTNQVTNQHRAHR